MIRTAEEDLPRHAGWGLGFAEGCSPATMPSNEPLRRVNSGFNEQLTIRNRALGGSARARAGGRANRRTV